MPKKDLYHNAVVNALAADDWRITDDPLHLSCGGRNLYIDLGADRPIGAEKEGRKTIFQHALITPFCIPSGIADPTLRTPIKQSTR